MKISQIPGSLAIVRLDESHYQLTDLSTPSIGLCLGVFPSDGAARSFAAKLESIRALRPRDQGGAAIDAVMPQTGRARDRLAQPGLFH